MHKELLQRLVDPSDKSPLHMDPSGLADEIVQDGQLVSESGHRYPIHNGIPRFEAIIDDQQQQTENSFGFKWTRTHSYGSGPMAASAQAWLLERYGFKNVEMVKNYFAGRDLILDAGCGSGFTASLWMDPFWQGTKKAQWVGADISSAIDVAKEKLGPIPGTHFIQADLMHLPFRDGSFDTIFSEGVLHHTPSVEKALQSLVSLLAPGGEILFYVYRKKSPLREFSDDYIRSQVSGLPPQEAWRALEPLTRLGQAIENLKAEIDVPEDIPYLGIRAGKHSLHRLLYWHVMKMFWKDDYSFEENNHINFDWYHPQYAHRQTEAELRGWCEKMRLTIQHFNSQESGFTVRALKRD
jgi:arsenite methyltransferase